MRTFLIATAAMATVSMAGTASAQPGPRWAAGGTAPHGSMAAAPMAQQAPAARPAPPPAAPHPGPMASAQGRHGNPGWHGRSSDWHGHSRWGRRDHGRWWGGWNAPGGWGAYRRPFVGWTLPGYWTSPGFTIDDYSDYGLGAPPPGYEWSRYYDDAVLADRDGRVRDYRGGVDWNRYPDAYDDEGPDRGPLDYDPYYHDYSADHDAAPYPFQRGFAPPPPATVTQYGGGCNCGGGYYAGGWYYPAPTTTVVTVHSEPVTTTRTYTDYVTTWRRGYAPVRVRHTKLLPRNSKLMRR